MDDIDTKSLKKQAEMTCFSSCAQERRVVIRRPAFDSSHFNNTVLGYVYITEVMIKRPVSAG